MKARTVLLLAAALLAVPVVSAEADASAGNVGEGSSDTMSVLYYELGMGIAVVTLADPPSVRTVGLLVIDSEGGYQRISVMPSSKVLAAEISPLAVGVYTFMVTDGQTQTPIAECDVTVHEQSQATYVVTFDPNGGSGTMAPLLVTDGRAVLPECTFDAPDGKRFDHWSVGGAAYQPESTVQVSSDTTVRAEWGSSSSQGVPIPLLIGIAAAVAIGAVAGMLIVRRRGARANHFRGREPPVTSDHAEPARSQPRIRLEGHRDLDEGMEPCTEN